MATPQTEIESKVLELATESLEAFCEDISGMFGVEMECHEKKVSTDTVATLKKRFKKLVAVNIVDAKGILDGTFQLIFDQEGLFTLGGVMVMLPEKRILANRKDASVDLAESMVDAVGEAGNLLIGAWERIFREELEGHGHLLQRLPAFVGKPWDEPEEKIGLAAEQEHTFIPYEMTIAPYPAFKCGVIFPKALFEGNSSEDSAGAAEAEPAEPAAEEKPAAETPQDEVSNSYTPDNEAAAAEGEAVDEKKQTPEPEAAEGKTDSEEPAATPEDAGEQSEPAPPEASAEQTDAAPEAETPEEAAKDETQAVEPSEEPALGPVSEAIKEMAKSAASPDESGISAPAKDAAPGHASELLWICAKDIMQHQVVWVGPEDSVQQALTLLQQNDLGYLAVGNEGVLEGIISKADVAGAMSPYLRPMFGKWRKPSDDATLQIRLKWIMSRPVRTARPDTPLATVLENMCRFGGRVLPVVDEQGKVHGMVTAFDIFQKLLNLGADVPTAGKSPQGPPL
jgi:CBS domain-containing protein